MTKIHHGDVEEAAAKALGKGRHTECFPAVVSGLGLQLPPLHGFCKCG